MRNIGGMAHDETPKRPREPMRACALVPLRLAQSHARPVTRLARLRPRLTRARRQKGPCQVSWAGISLFSLTRSFLLPSPSARANLGPAAAIPCRGALFGGVARANNASRPAPVFSLVPATRRRTSSPSEPRCAFWRTVRSETPVAAAWTSAKLGVAESATPSVC